MVGFFQVALKNAGIGGKVIASDPEYNAPSLQAGDENYVIPRANGFRLYGKNHGDL